LALVASACASAAAFWGEGSDSDASLQCSADSGQMLQALLSQPQPCSTHTSCPRTMVCVSGQCSACSSDDQCKARLPENRCGSSSSHGGRFCAHKTLWEDFGGIDVLLLIIVFFSTALSAPTGTGGGGIMVPVFMLLCGFSAQDAIPLSKATIFGLAVSNNYLNMQKRHPTADRPLIDYNAVCMLEPMLLLGTIVGVFLNAVSPNWLITVCLILVLTYTVYRTALKARQFYLEESHADSSAPNESSPLITQDPDVIVAPGHVTSVTDDAGLITDESDMLPLRKLGYLCATWLAIFASAVIKGGDGTKGFVPCGSSAYWAVVLLPATVAVPLTVSFGKELIQAGERKKMAGIKSQRGDLKWDSRSVTLYPAICFGCGIAAGALGIAAGMVLSPILLELGMIPAVAAATSGFTVLFTSSCTSLQFLVLGHLSPSYGIACCLVGCAGAFVGNTVVHYYIQKYKKTYVIVALLTAILALSVCLLAYSGISSLVKSIENGEAQGFTPLCTSAGVPDDIENAAFAA